MVMATNDNNDGNNGFSFGAQPFAWVLIPLFVIFVLGLTATIIQVKRRRRRRGSQWPGQNTRAPAYTSLRGARRTTNRVSPWSGTRTEEGLNELGQAPPPYDGMKETQDPLELRDLEAGNRPPEYPDEPAPAVVTDGRRS
ncbi:pgaD domain protein [Fusarium beomiforme]|uniref:PgaD domain protein n=1 Tax=Fusarium beomiforme TaxID=44412 RepID=A0A9P5ACN3_9HYPO|nr:pgaD domain protein [Fusarium beomiforme]